MISMGYGSPGPFHGANKFLLHIFINSIALKRDWGGTIQDRRL